MKIWTNTIDASKHSVVYILFCHDVKVRDCPKLVGGLKYSSKATMARSEVERAASPFYVEPAGGRLYIPTDYFGTVSQGNVNS